MPKVKEKIVKLAERERRKRARKREGGVDRERETERRDCRLSKGRAGGRICLGWPGQGDGVGSGWMERRRGDVMHIDVLPIIPGARRRMRKPRATRAFCARSLRIECVSGMRKREWVNLVWSGGQRSKMFQITDTARRLAEG